MKARLFEITFESRETLLLPRYNKGNVFRGAFGSALRNLVCMSRDSLCPTCGVSECPYRSFFAPVGRPDSAHLSKNAHIPRPYVVRPPLDRKTHYNKGDAVSFEMALFGNTEHMLPYILMTLKTTAERGIGSNRGVASLARVIQKNPVTGETHELYSGADGLIRPSNLHFSDADFPVAPAHEAVCVFKTPTIIMDAGKVVQVPAFDSVMKRLRDRFAALSWFYEDALPEMDFKNYPVQAAKVKATRVDLAWIQTGRRTRDDKRQDMSGFAGTIRYEGPISAYLPLLLFGQYMHVGKAAVFGNGMYDVRTT